jgi:chemotaxis protein histidine kinase CheA
LNIEVQIIMKKNTKITFSRSFSILAAAALSMTLIGGQTFPAYAENSSGIESGAVIPDNITIDSPTALANIALPSNAYGTLSWADSSYVPDKRVQSCGVVFKPAAGADLSGLPGWDSNSGTLTGSVTVVVSSIDSTEENSGSEESSDSSDSDSGESYGTDDKEENGTDVNESDADTSVKETEDSTAENEGKNEGLQTDSVQENENKEDSETTGKTEQSSSDSSDTADASGEEKRDPEITEAPEVTAAPSEDNKTQDGEEAEAVETPAVTITPAAEDDMDPDAASESRDDENHEKNNDAEITAIPEITETPDAEENKNNIFDRKDDTEDKRPQNAATDLTETEKEEIASQNHTCDGITVSGIDLPWYVQFRVSGGEDYQFTNEEDATIFKSYEFELWDTQNNTEYKIPDGEYISVTVPVKAGYTYSIEHLLDNGAMETIIPSVDGDTMTFSTHSFSPFGIAGSKSLVGPDAESNTGATVTPAADASSSDTASSGTADSAETDSTDTNTAETSQNLTSDSTDQEQSSSQNSDTAENEAEEQSSATTSKKQVNTGDNTQILPFVILFVAAAVVAGVAVFFKKRKK